MSAGNKNHSSYTIHNKVRSVHGGSEYFMLMEQMIDAARYTVHLHVYIYDADETGEIIASALMRAAERGVQVYVLADGFASRGLPSEFKQKLRSAGVNFCLFEPFFRSKSFYIGRRMHHKILVVDSSQALVAGINISNRYNDILGAIAWLDWAVHVKGEVAVKLNDFCILLWNSSSQRNRCKPFSFPLETVEEQCMVRMRRNDWVTRKTQIFQSYMELFSSAQSNITLMSGYFWPGRKLLNKMAAATKRGVKIRLMLAGISDVPIAKSAERYIYRWLFRNNIEVYEYQGSVLHGKIAVADSAFVTVGSYNVNNISAYASLELNLDIRDNTFAVCVEEELSSILDNHCIKITEELFNKKYHMLQRLWQRIAFDLVHIIFFLFTFYFRQIAAKKRNKQPAE